MNNASLSEILLGVYLRWTGKRHLIPLLKSLKHAGRPADVAFPAELVEQGLSLVLAGLNNTMAMQSNSSWVWPYWVERQIDPESDAFLPTGTNVIKSNLTARNWTSLGVEGSQREAMVDPVGMITLRPYGWSWFPYVRVDGVGFYPPRLTGTRQELREGTLPAVITHYQTRPDIEWSSECLALRGPALSSQRDDTPEWLSCTHTVRNLSSRRLTLTFGIALRPYNPLMFSPIGAIRHDRVETMGDEGRESGVFLVNGKPALLMPQAPDRVTLSNRWQGDSLQHPERGKSVVRLESDSGMVSAAAEYHWVLEPGETRHLNTLGVIARSRRSYGRGGIARIPSPAVIDALRAGELQRLREAERTGLQIEIPHDELTKAFRAVKGRITVFDDGDRFTPGSFLYHGHWFRDAAFIALAFDQIGFGDRVASKMDASLKRQDRSGFFRSQNGEWDSNGQALWTVIGHVQRGGDPALLAHAWPALWRGALWIDRMRHKTKARPKTSEPGKALSTNPHFGLLPAGFSAEHFGPNDHYYWDALWSIAGLEKLLWAARFLKHAREATRLEAMIADFRADVDASMDASFRRAGSVGLPCSPYRDLDSAAVGNLVGLSPLGVIKPGVEWVSGTVEYLARHNLRDGLFLQKIIHTGLNPYLSAQVARALLVRQDPRAITVLESLLRHGGPTLAWPEAIHPRTGGGCMGDGDHGWAASEFLSLMRDVLVREEEGKLLLCSGVPAAWFRPGEALGVTGAPTLHGTITYRMTWGTEHTDGDNLFGGEKENARKVLIIEWACQRKPHQDAGTIVFCLPLSLGRSLIIPTEICEAYGPHLRVRLAGAAGRMVFSSKTTGVRTNRTPHFTTQEG